MAKVIVSDSHLFNIAEAIRSKNGSEDTYMPSEMAEAIEAISGGGITPTGTINITENGTHNVTNYASANVNVPSSGITPTGTKQISITQNGTTTEDVTNYASAEITDNVPSGGSSLPKTGTITPSERSGSISFDVGTTDTVQNVIIYPTSESPVKSGGKTVVAFFGMASGYYKYIGCTTNNTGSSFLTPASSTSNPCFTQSGSTITVSPTSAGSFETISYTWVAW